MPSVPRIICANCNIPMSGARSGVILDCHAAAMPYYKVMSDKYRCNGCGAEAYAGFGQAVEHYQSDYKVLPATVTVLLEPHLSGFKPTHRTIPLDELNVALNDVRTGENPSSLLRKWFGDVEPETSDEEIG